MPKSSRRVGPRAGVLDRFALYELCVTNAGPLAWFLEAVHGKKPRVLGEDFSGTGALARAWAARSGQHSAVCVDRDAEPLARLAGVERVEAVRGEVLRCRRKVDVLACTNFPLGYWHTRKELLRYLKHARSRLNARGIFAADLYGGGDAFTPGRYVTRQRGPNGERVEYTWQQHTADPLTGLVTNHIHFRVWDVGARKPRVLDHAFTYHWRVWSIPELRDALIEAGFRRVEVYASLGGVVDGRGKLMVRPTEDPGELSGEPGGAWVVYAVARG